MIAISKDKRLILDFIKEINLKFTRVDIPKQTTKLETPLHVSKRTSGGTECCTIF
jgi:hypothetical protein